MSVNEFAGGAPQAMARNDLGASGRKPKSKAPMSARSTVDPTSAICPQAEAHDRDSAAHVFIELQGREIETVVEPRIGPTRNESAIIDGAQSRPIRGSTTVFYFSPLKLYEYMGCGIRSASACGQIAK